MSLFDKPRKAKYYKIKSSQLGDSFIQNTALKINDALKKIGANFYQVCSRLHEKGNKQFFKLSWRKLGNQCFTGQDRNNYPNASYTSEKRVREVLQKEYGITLSEIENNTEEAIRKAKEKYSSKESAKLEKQKAKMTKAESRKAKAEEKAKRKAEKETEKKAKAQTKKEKKVATPKVKKEKKVIEKKIEKEVEKVQQIVKEAEKTTSETSKEDKYEKASATMDKIAEMINSKLASMK